MSAISASATWLSHDRFVAHATSGHALVMDAGKDKLGCSPVELVLIGLCGCTASDVVNILRKKREPLSGLEVRAEAERAPEPPMVYTAIRLVYRVTGKVSRKAMEDAVRLSKDKYCSVSAMLHQTAKITFEIEYAESA